MRCRPGRVWRPLNTPLGVARQVCAIRTRLEDAVASLCGESLRAVRYWLVAELTAGDEIRETCDELDFGVELEFASRRVVGVSWNSDYWQYSLGVYEGGLGSTVRDATVLDASARSPWKHALNTVLESSTLIWDRAGYVGSEPVEFPYCLELVFSSGTRVSLAAAYYDQANSAVVAGGDSILVSSPGLTRGSDA